MGSGSSAWYAVSATPANFRDGSRVRGMVLTTFPTGSRTLDRVAAAGHVAVPSRHPFGRAGSRQRIFTSNTGPPSSFMISPYQSTTSPSAGTS